jgi:phenylacetate-CoA ligase
MRLRDCATLAHLILTQWGSAAYVKRVQSRRLRRLVRHAYERVPYYRELFDSRGIRPQDIRSADDLRLLPVSTKADLQGRPTRDLTARGTDLARCRLHTTSGTTGLPLEVYFRRDDWTRLVLGNIRAFVACGARPWDRVTAFVGRTDASRKKSWYEYLGLWNQQDLSSWSPPSDWIAEIRKWKPQTLVGCVIALRLLAEAIQEQQVTDIRPQVVISGSNVLDDFTRRLFESVFRCEVADFYGATEGGALAWECKKCHGYHVSSDILALEVLRDGEPAAEGEEGEVVITNLQYFAMPFIRYKLGDIATLSNRASRCGRGLPLLEHIGGRKDEWISLPGGRRIPCQPFYYAIQSVPGVRRWKVFQESLTRLRVDIEPGPSFGPQSREQVEANLRKLLGGEIEPEIVLAASIHIDPVMKFRQVSSNVAPKDASNRENNTS